MHNDVIFQFEVRYSELAGGGVCKVSAKPREFVMPLSCDVVNISIITSVNRSVVFRSKGKCNSLTALRQ